MTTYEIWYETENHINLITIHYGELAEFKRTCKRYGWKIKSIDTVKNGIVTKRNVF